MPSNRQMMAAYDQPPAQFMNNYLIETNLQTAMPKLGNTDFGKGQPFDIDNLQFLIKRGELETDNPKF